MKALNILLISMLFLVSQSTSAGAQVFTVKSYKVTIAGTSTLHDWESNVEKLECNGSIALVNHVIGDIKDVVVKIPVKAIKSTKGKIMDTKTWEAFNYEKNPFIIFAVTDSRISSSAATIGISGDLTMNGVTRNIKLALTTRSLPGGEFVITGCTPLLMSDYQMVPPTAMMGTIKVGPEVTISFEVIINPNNTL